MTKAQKLIALQWAGPLWALWYVPLLMSAWSGRMDRPWFFTLPGVVAITLFLLVMVTTRWLPWWWTTMVVGALTWWLPVAPLLMWRVHRELLLADH